MKQPSSRHDYSSSFLVQLYYLSRRTFLSIIRNPLCALLQTSIGIGFGFLVGVIYFQLSLDVSGAIQNRVGAFFMMVLFLISLNLIDQDLLIKERQVFLHESAGGYYRVSSYFFSKIFCDLLPLRLILLILLVPIAYLMAGFRLTAANFFIFFLDLFLTTVAGSAIGFAINSAVGNFSVSCVLTSTTYLLMEVFSGILVNVKTMTAALSWLQYFSVVRYSLNVLEINELYEQEYYYLTSDGSRRRIIGYPGNDYMTSQGVDFGTAWDLWKNIIALLVMTIMMFFFAYLQLRRITAMGRT